jgi:hypothetical protein
MKHPTMKCTRWQLQWLSRLICVPAVMLFVVLSAHAQTDVVLPPLGGDGGGKFIARCPQGQLLTGFQLWTGDDVDAIRVICVTASGPADVGPLVAGGEYFGGNGGGARYLLCPKDAPIVTGMEIGAVGADTVVVHDIHLWCGVAASTQTPGESPTAEYNGPPFTKGKSGLLGIGSDPPAYAGGAQRCRAGSVAVGINGRSGVWLDAVGLICGVPTLTPKAAREPGPVKALGRVEGGAPTGPPISICESARRARARNSPAAPGLEAQCRAAGAAGEIPPKAPVKALGRVEVPPGTTPNPPISICESARRARARNSPAAPGLEAQCRAAGAAGETPPAIVADTNPVMVPKGQASGPTTITWKAGPDYSYCEIYLSVDNGQWSEFARGPDGTKLATIKLGSSYTFRMMVYEGQAGTPKIITTLTVTAAKN